MDRPCVHKDDLTKPPLIEQDNSIRTYNVVFDGVETDAQMFYNHLYTEEEDYDLINNLGKHSVAMMVRKVNEWRAAEIEAEHKAQLEEDEDAYYAIIAEGISN